MPADVIEGLDEHHVEIVTAEKTYTTVYLILAEGANARITNCFWDDDRILAPALESEVMLPPDKLAEYQGIARFDFDVISSGYAWVFPKKDHISVGIGHFLNTKVGLNKIFDAYKQQLGLSEAYIERNRKGFVIPIKPRQAPYMKQRMILVGDAAGFADSITAEGFTYALKSGIEAGKAIVKGNSPEEVFNLYHEGIREVVVQELHIINKLSKPFYISQKIRNTLFKQYGERLCRGMANVLEGKQTYHKAFSKHDFIAHLLLGSK